MPDPIEELQSFDPGGPMSPLPASEVRRRGDRHRRRRTTGVALAAAAAVAVVTTGSMVLAGGEPRTAPDPAGPSPSVTTSAPDLAPIPDDFPLAAGWPAPRGETVLEGPGRPTEAYAPVLCGRELPLTAASDRLLARLSGAAHPRTRQLSTFADAAAAKAEVKSILDGHLACPQEVEDEDTGDILYTELRPVTVGAQSQAYVRISGIPGYGPTPGTEVLLVVRVGRSVVLDATSSGARYDERALKGQIEDQAAALADPIAAMCAFTKAGC